MANGVLYGVMVVEVKPAIMLHFSVDTYCLCGHNLHQLNVMLGKVFHRKVLCHHHLQSQDGQLSGRVGGGGGGWKGTGL